MKGLGWFVAGAALGWLGAQRGEGGPEHATRVAGRKQLRRQLKVDNDHASYVELRREREARDAYWAKARGG